MKGGGGPSIGRPINVSHSTIASRSARDMYDCAPATQLQHYRCGEYTEMTY